MIILYYANFVKIIYIYKSLYAHIGGFMGMYESLYVHIGGFKSIYESLYAYIGGFKGMYKSLYAHIGSFISTNIYFNTPYLAHFTTQKNYFKLLIILSFNFLSLTINLILKQQSP